MTKQEIIAVAKAFNDGEAIEFRHCGMEEWSDCTEPLWLDRCDYRVKRREFWINRYGWGKCVHVSKEEADIEAINDRIDCLHVREV